MSLDITLSKPGSMEYHKCPHCERWSDESIDVFDINITHNLNIMADLAGIYEVIWRPDELGVVFADEILPELEAGLRNLKSNPNEYRELNPENGWGSYEVLVEVVTAYIQACKENPNAVIEVDR